MIQVAQVAVCSQINKKTHIYGVGRAYICMLNVFVHHVTSRLKRLNIDKINFRPCRKKDEKCRF
jgi:hypothetical protein